MRRLRWLILLPPLAFLLHFHWQVLTFPLAHEGTEAAVALSAGLLAQGGDPTAASSILHDLPYGFVEAQLAALAGPRLAGEIVFHRWISAVCLLLVLILLWREAARRGCDSWVSAAALLGVYAGLLVWVTPHARPDALCLLLMVAAILCAVQEKPALWQACLCGALGVLAFYTKAYGAMAVLTGAYLLALRRDKAALLRLGGAALLTALLCHAWVLHRFEAYYPVTFDIQSGAVTWNGHYLLAQTGFFLRQQGLLVLALAVALWLQARNSRPLMAAAPLLPALGALLLLGGHLGAFMSYFCQLALPWLALPAAAWTPPRGAARALLACLLGANAYASAWVLRGWHPWDTAACSRMVASAGAIFAGAQPGQVLAGAEFLPFVQRYGQVLADNDDLRWFRVPGNDPPSSPEAGLLGLQRAAARHVQALQAELRRGRYEWVLLNAQSPVLDGADLQRYEKVADRAYHAPGNPFSLPSSMLWLKRKGPP